MERQKRKRTASLRSLKSRNKTAGSDGELIRAPAQWRKPLRQGENIQTHRKAVDRESNMAPSCCRGSTVSSWLHTHCGHFGDVKRFHTFTCTHTPYTYTSCQRVPRVQLKEAGCLIISTNQLTSSLLNKERVWEDKWDRGICSNWCK